MTTYGWDMSHFDAPGIGTALAEGVKFITHKAGGDAPDSEIGAWWSGVKDFNTSMLMVGAYWVLYPGNPTERADAFIARLDATCPGWRDRPFILQVDCEKWNNNSATVPSKSEIQIFCARLMHHMPKLWPIVYAPKWVYGNTLTGLGYPLWASAYVSGSGGFKALYPGDKSSQWSAYSGQTPEILQYTSSAVIGGQTTCDANAYRGTLAELQNLLAPGWSTDVNVTDVEQIWNQDGIATNPRQRADAQVNPTVRAAFALEDAWQQIYNLKDQLTNLTTTLTTQLGVIANRPEVDVPALAAALKTELGDLSGLTMEQIETAVRNVFHGA